MRTFNGVAIVLFPVVLIVGIVLGIVYGG